MDFWSDDDDDTSFLLKCARVRSYLLWAVPLWKINLLFGTWGAHKMLEVLPSKNADSNMRPYAQQCSLDNLFPTQGGHVCKAPLIPKREGDWVANIHQMLYANKVKWKAWTHTQLNCMEIDPSFSTLISVAMRTRSLDPASTYAFGNRSGLAPKW